MTAGMAIGGGMVLMAGGGGRGAVGGDALGRWWWWGSRGAHVVKKGGGVVRSNPAGQVIFNGTTVQLYKRLSGPNLTLTATVVNVTFKSWFNVSCLSRTASLHTVTATRVPPHPLPPPRGPVRSPRTNRRTGWQLHSCVLLGLLQLYRSLPRYLQNLAEIMAEHHEC